MVRRLEHRPSISMCYCSYCHHPCRRLFRTRQAERKCLEKSRAGFRHPGECFPLLAMRIKVRGMPMLTLRRASARAKTFPARYAESRPLVPPRRSRASVSCRGQQIESIAHRRHRALLAACFRKISPTLPGLCSSPIGPSSLASTHPPSWYTSCLTPFARTPTRTHLRLQRKVGQQNRTEKDGCSLGISTFLDLSIKGLR